MWSDMLSVSTNYLMGKSHIVHFLTGTNGHPIYTTECGLQGKVPYNFMNIKQPHCKKCEERNKFEK